MRPKAGETWVTERGGVVTLTLGPGEELWSESGGGVWNPDGSMWLRNGSTARRFGNLVRKVTTKRAATKPINWQRVAARMASRVRAIVKEMEMPKRQRDHLLISIDANEALAVYTKAIKRGKK